MKDANLKDLINQVEKKFGKESIMLLGESSTQKIKTTSSGSFIIDNILGIGGYPEGRIIELYGPESSGKTTIALHAIVEAQKEGKVCAFIDAEHSLDPIYANNLGVNTKKLIISQPDSGEQALEIVDTLIKSNITKLIIIDSVAALVPEAELKGEMSDNSIGLQARLMSKALRKITGSINKSNCTVIFINQLREKIGRFFGNPEITPGGRALKFYSSIRIEVRRIKRIGIGENIRGNEVRIKISKNKLAPPYKVGETKIMFSKGISLEAEILQLAEDYELIKRKGAWFSHGDKNFAKGRNQAEEYLEQNSKFTQGLILEIKKQLKK